LDLRAGAEPLPEAARTIAEEMNSESRAEAETTNSQDDPMDSWDPFADTSPDLEEADPSSNVGLPPSGLRSPSDPFGQEFDDAEEFPPLETPVRPRQPSEESLQKPIATSYTAWIPGALATLVGLALIAGVVNAQRLALLPVPGPGQVVANGWTASNLNVRALSGPRGTVSMEIRGRLTTEGTHLPPRVQVTLLDGRHQPLGSSTTGELIRTESSPEGVPGEVTGFHVRIPQPPVHARRFQLDLAVQD
jgi:hypothetical protein